ncbi:glutamate racemase [Alkaliphilus sp. MSJ-5]|uniref:Glutamate racemase n=1 Tax=Alkaliphilus flagellatus TaxID=2841507 RepID=A0ABS6G3N6_9FIRM|nr:glutamate racemase [Alkaliphilus flagellatus]MBU5677095.1 glutamate racemase [Alkaliphilus flagellatus]
MKEGLANLPIGVFDSGVGGISVLADLVHQLPDEEYIYFGDSGNAPYGVRSKDEIKELSFNVVDYLLNLKIKALVVACNTATSVAIEELRSNLDIPVIGMEPALKPAIELNRYGKIVVMATPVTLREKKFNDLIEKFKHTTNVVKMPCPGLVEIIEKKGKYASEIEEYIKKVFLPYNLDEIGTIVLGCTHYVFIKDIIADIVGENISIVDGNLGTARHVKHLLENNGTLMPISEENCKETKIKVINSSNDIKMVSLSKKLIEERLKDLEWCGTIKYI